MYKGHWVIRSSDVSLKTQGMFGLVIQQPFLHESCWTLLQLFKCWAYCAGERDMGKCPFGACVRIWEKQL